MSESLMDAVKLLELKEETSLNEINSRYRELLFKWHPDRCRDNPEECKDMTEKIIRAYKTVMSYCYDYRITLSAELSDKISPSDSPDEFWHKRFGQDPLWGYSE
ncbi:MAG TPA: J domain-containing protein [Spirochaetota bacterium]|nr:J domain-containing protein [Spirochaetota bacterium]HPJ35822.1 J domain-containing protein [Spirochaetota bacterium]